MDLIKRWLPNIALSLVSIVIVLICVELLLRATLFRSLLNAGGEPENYYVHGGETGYDIGISVSTTTHHFADGKYPVWSNKLGCFDDEYNGESSFALLVGDSFTWGYSPFNDKWGTLLQNHLNLRILKCGVSGFGTAQEYMKATHLLKSLPHPKYIIVGYYGNDESDDLTFSTAADSYKSATTSHERQENVEKTKEIVAKYCTTTIPSHPLFQRIKCFLRQNTVTYILLQDAIKAGAPPGALSRLGITTNEAPPMPTTSIELRTHFKNILAFKKLADQEHAQLIFVMLPSKVEVEGTASTSVRYSVGSFMVEPAMIESYLRMHNIAYIDPLMDFRSVRNKTQLPLYWKFDGHINVRGNHLLSLLVAKYLLEKDKKSSEAHYDQVISALKTEFNY